MRVDRLEAICGGPAIEALQSGFDRDCPHPISAGEKGWLSTMDARKKNLEEILLARRQHVIPEYQRPYVWTPEEHVQPFLQDIETLCERSLRGIPAREHPHFAGALVLQKVPRDGYDAMDTWAVVDGQQRMTTVQLIMRALANVAIEYELDPAPHLRFLHNEGDHVENPDDRWKLWPTWNVRDRWRTLIGDTMANDATDDDSLRQLVENLTFSHEQIATWARTASDVGGLTADVAERDRVERKLQAYHMALRNGLQFVVVDLLADENAQIIFETLNGTGARLLAADLVKNHVFRAAEENNESLEVLARDIWAPFDTNRWRREIGRGHRRRPRIEYFLQHWLMAETAEETPNQEVFSAFRVLFDDLHRSSSVLDDAREFRLASDAYDALDAPKGAVQERMRHLVDLLGLQTVLPVLLRLELDVRAGRWAPAEQDEALSVIESWIARRMLLRLNTRAYGTTFVEMVSVLRDASRRPAESLRELLGRKTSDANRWPLDEEVLNDLPRLPLYGGTSQPRIVYALRELEVGLRTSKGEGLNIPAKLSIEHIIPQSWAANWPLADDSEAARATRLSLIHTIGNLTVVVQRLNAGLSNAAWTTKRAELNKHSELMLNRRLCDENPEQFSDRSVADRGLWIAEQACIRWPRTGPVPDEGVLELARQHTVRDEDTSMKQGVDEEDLESLLTDVDGDRYVLLKELVGAYRDGTLSPAHLRRKGTDHGMKYLRVHLDSRSAAIGYLYLRKSDCQLEVGPDLSSALSKAVPAERLSANKGGWTRVNFGHGNQAAELIASVVAVATTAHER